MCVPSKTKQRPPLLTSSRSHNVSSIALGPAISYALLHLRIYMEVPALFLLAPVSCAPAELPNYLLRAGLSVASTGHVWAPHTTGTGTRAGSRKSKLCSTHTARVLLRLSRLETTAARGCSR